MSKPAPAFRRRLFDAMIADEPSSRRAPLPRGPDDGLLFRKIGLTKAATAATNGAGRREQRKRSATSGGRDCRGLRGVRSGNQSWVRADGNRLRWMFH